MGKSQETPQQAVGRNGKRGFGGGSPHYGFFLGRYPAACCGVLHHRRGIERGLKTVGAIKIRFMTNSSTPTQPGLHSVFPSHSGGIGTLLAECILSNIIERIQLACSDCLVGKYVTTSTI